MSTEQMFELSDERDQWHRYAMGLARWMYECGYRDGRADERREADQAWAAIPVQRILYGPTLAELEAARWTVRGEQRTQETFGQPHPADRKGQAQERAA